MLTVWVLADGRVGQYWLVWEQWRRLEESEDPHTTTMSGPVPHPHHQLTTQNTPGQPTTTTTQLQVANNINSTNNCRSQSVQIDWESNNNNSDHDQSSHAICVDVDPLIIGSKYRSRLSYYYWSESVQFSSWYTSLPDGWWMVVSGPQREIMTD